MLVLRDFIGGMDGEAPGLLTLREMGGLLWPVSVLLLLYLLSLVCSIQLWRKGRQEGAGF